MAGKREPLSVSIGDSPGQPRDCELEPACSELLRDPEAVLRDRNRWPNHLCYWTLHRSIERLTGIPDHWPEMGPAQVDRVFALQLGLGPHREMFEICGYGAWRDGVMTFRGDMDDRWRGWASEAAELRAELFGLATRWWNENLAGKRAEGGRPVGSTKTPLTAEEFLERVGPHVAALRARGVHPSLVMVAEDVFGVDKLQDAERQLRRLRPREFADWAAVLRALE